MGKRWRIALPTIGLLLFATQTYVAVRWNHERRTESRHFESRYFWWSGIRLDTEPHKQQPQEPTQAECKGSTEDCVGWDPVHIWVEPSPLSKIMILSAFPAFVLGAIIVGGLSRFGVNEFASFMFSMPALLFAWYLFIGWLLDRRRYGRQMLKTRRGSNH